MNQRSRREAAKPTPDPVLTRLVWLAALWLGSRLIAGVIAAPFLGEGAQLDPARLVITQVPFWAATVGGLYWISRREGERFGPFVRWGFKPPDALVGLVAGFGLHWGVNLLYRALDSVGVSGDPSESARKLVEASPGVLGKVTLVVMVSVGAPLVEELYYRGVAQRTAVELAGGTAAPCVNRRSALGAAVGIGAFGLRSGTTAEIAGRDDESLLMGSERSANLLNRSVTERPPPFMISVTMVLVLSNQISVGTPPMCSNIVRRPSSRHSVFSP